LWHTDGVGRWAGGSVGKAVAGDGVEHMRLMVRAIQVYTIPASRCS
jgi:hypothetical protein